MLWTRAVGRAPMTPLRLVLAGAAGSAAADFGDQDPRGLTHTVIGSPVVRGNRLAISQFVTVGLRAARLFPSSPVTRRVWGSGRSRSRGERDEIGVLEDFAVDRHRHAFLDLTAEAGVPAVAIAGRRAALDQRQPRINARADGVLVERAATQLSWRSLRSARASSSWRAKATRRYQHNLGERLAATAYRNTG